jgi:hypothetical protein
MKMIASKLAWANFIRRKSPGLIVLLVMVTASCSPAALTQTPVYFTVTHTPSPSPSASSTPSPTATLSPTGTATPTITSTPTFTPTPTRTPTPIPRVIFQDDFERGLLWGVSGSAHYWNYLHYSGSVVEVIDDPTALNKGKVMKASIAGESRFDQETYKRRGYPDWYNGSWPYARNLSAPCEMSVDLWMSREIYRTINAVSPAWFSPLSIFANHYRTGEVYWVATLGIDRFGNLNMGAGTGLSDDRREYRELQGRLIAETWGRLTLRVERNGKILPFLDGELLIDPENAIRIPSQAKIGTIGGHAGLYTGTGNRLSDLKYDFPEGAYILNDNFEILCWDAVSGN